MALKMLEKKNKSKDEDKKTTTPSIKEEKPEQQEKRKKSKSGKKNKVSTAVVVKSRPNIFYPRPLLPLWPTPLVSTITTYYYFQTFTQPFALEWNPIVPTLPTIQVVSPVYPLPFQSFPILISPIVPPICPYSCPVLTPQIMAPVVPPPIVTEIPAGTCTYDYEPSVSGVSYVDQTNKTETQAEEQTNEVQDKNAVSNVEEIIESPIQAANDTFCSVSEDTNVTHDDVTIQDLNVDPIEIYLSLPKNLFPAPRMLTIDPNPIIDEFCKLKNVHHHVPWLLDLEYGMPRSPVPRQIPIYNVNRSSIHCKNAPDTVHPGFNSCDENFKKVMLYYYDCIVSSFYRGYMKLNDASVENFQNWLQMPMQVLGMCWP